MQGASGVRSRQGMSYALGDHPRLRALLRAGERPREFGHKVWASSWILIEHLDTRPFSLQGLRVLEVGCGWGLVGVYLAKRHGCQVTCADLDEQVLPIVRLQAELNGVSVETRRASFDELSADFLEGFDLLVGVEICYSEEAARDLRKLVARALAAGVGQLMIVDPGRPDFTELLAHCTAHHQVLATRLPGSANGKTTHLMQIMEESA